MLFVKSMFLLLMSFCHFHVDIIFYFMLIFMLLSLMSHYIYPFCSYYYHDSLMCWRSYWCSCVYVTNLIHILLRKCICCGIIINSYSLTYFCLFESSENSKKESSLRVRFVVLFRILVRIGQYLCLCFLHPYLDVKYLFLFR